jgi:hypothetical protein
MFADRYATPRSVVHQLRDSYHDTMASKQLNGKLRILQGSKQKFLIYGTGLEAPYFFILKSGNLVCATNAGKKG